MNPEQPSGFDFAEPLRLSERLTLPERVILSPMQGVMTGDFLHAAASLRLIRCWFTPFFSTGGVSVPKGAAIRRKLAPYRAHPELPIVFQLIGRDPGSIAASAQRFAEAGVEGVNLNFACPSRTVTASGNGASLLRNPDRIFNLTEAVVHAVPPGVSVSVKLRAGWDSASNLRVLIQAVRAAGADWIVFHYRTAAEFYGNEAKSKRFERIAAAVEAAGPVPLFGNGDVDGWPDAAGMVQQTGCAGIAVGRGFLSNPFLLRRIAAGSAAPPSREEKTALLRELAAGMDPERRGRRDCFLECVRMTFGADSPEFAMARHANLREILDYFLRP